MADPVMEKILIWRLLSINSFFSSALIVLSFSVSNLYLDMVSATWFCSSFRSHFDLPYFCPEFCDLFLVVDIELCILGY